MSCFVIAECGVNWRDLVDADQMIKAAAEAGADACKFQCYKPDFKPISTKERRFVQNHWRDMKCGSPAYEYAEVEIPTPGGHPRAEELNRIALDESTIRYLYWRCQQHGIEFMCTPMYPEAVVMLDPFVKRWKVRYADRENEAIFAPCRATGKPMLISGGNIFCISEYPPGPPENTLLSIRREFPFDGVSSHFPTNKPDYFGYKFIEVHVRLDHYEPPHYCPIDTAVSITMSELADLCRRFK